MISKAHEYINQTASIAARSCNRLMIGRVFWKGVALPSLLHSTEAIFLTKDEIDKLQVPDNKAYRLILSAPSIILQIVLCEPKLVRPAITLET